MAEEEGFITDSLGHEHCDVEHCLSVLLHDDVLFANERRFLDGKDVDGPTVVLFVNCNDLFAWGCADAESLPYDEVGKLFRMHRANAGWGSQKWCAIRRNLKPQPPAQRLMEMAGAWDAQMEALPDSPFKGEWPKEALDRYVAGREERSGAPK